MSNQSQAEFGRLRSFFWPIHSFEIKKVLPMFLMLFCINFNYTILRDMKDTLVQFGKGGGAEAIPFLKGWVVWVAALLFMMGYMKLSNVLSKKKLFYATLVPFLVFFTLFATVLYPYQDMFHPTTSADALNSWLSANVSEGWAKGVTAVYRNWTYSVFYVCAELWGSVVLSLLFWGFANDITRVSESKRFYTFFLVGAQVAMLVSGPLIMWVTRLRNSLPDGIDKWQVSLNYLITFVIISGFATMACYWYMNSQVLSDSRFFDPKDVKKKKSKPKMGVLEGIKYLASSKYVATLAFLVLAYGMSINLVEVIWKKQLKLQYPTENEYMEFMGFFSTCTGAMTLFMLIFVSGNVIRRLGWGFAAAWTPTALLVSALVFFAFIVNGGDILGIVAMMGTTPLMVIVMAGMIQNIASKSSKYSLFDPTKEMAYIPLGDEERVKAKAAIDVAGGRLGKSGGAWTYQALLLAVSGLESLGVVVGVIVLAIISCWLLAVRSLNKQFIEKSAEREHEHEEEKAPASAAGLKPAPAAG